MASFTKVLTTVLPWIGAAATSGVPGLVGMAAQTVGGIVQKKLGANPEEIASAVANASTDQIAAMKAADNDFALKMQALGFSHEEELQKIAEQDRESARARQSQVKDYIPAILAISITAGFFTVLGIVAFHGVNANSRELVDVMLGSLGTAWISVVTYYFGSSASSSEKNTPEYIAAIQGSKAGK